MANPAQAPSSALDSAKLASMSDHSPGNDNVNSARSAGSGGGTKGMNAGVTGGGQIGDFLASGSLDNITATESLGSDLSRLGGALEQDPIAKTFDDGNMSFAKIGHEGHDLKSGVGNIQLEQATGIVNNTGFAIAGNTAIVSQGGGRE